MAAVVDFGQHALLIDGACTVDERMQEVQRDPNDCLMESREAIHLAVERQLFVHLLISERWEEGRGLAPLLLADVHVECASHLELQCLRSPHLKD